MKFLLLLLTSVTILHAAKPEAKTYTAPNGTTFPYQLYSPESPDPQKKYPLVLFLHGKGERGDDNRSQLKQGLPHLLKNAAKLNQPLFLIAPQCPQTDYWAIPADLIRLADATGPHPLLDAVLALTAETANSLPVDPSRIYITGLSMGGFGTWSALAKKPTCFAAALPICGCGDPKTAASFRSVPIRIFHGKEDKTVPPVASQLMFDALHDAGADATLTLCPGTGHDSWTRTYSDLETVRWFLSQRKSP